MSRSFFNKLKRILVPLRFSILSIFVTLFVTSILLLVFINYNNSSKTLLEVAHRLMHEVSTNIYREFTREIDNAERDNTFSAQMIRGGILDSNNLNEMVTYTLDLTRRFHIVHAAYWGDEEGNMVGTEYESDESMTSEIITNGDPPKRTLIYRDFNEKVLRQHVSYEVDYDPRKTPWYEAAKKEKRTVWTDIYLYSPSNYLAITVATPVYKKTGDLQGVFSLDIRIDYLSWYITKQKITKNAFIFIVTTDGKLVAFPKFEVYPDQSKLIDIHKLPNMPWIAESFDVYKNSPREEFSFNYMGKNYLAVYKAMPHFTTQGWYIGIVIPRDDFIGELRKTTMINMGIGFVILILGILFVSGLVTRVVHPIKKLVKQTEKIKHFELEDHAHVRSRIKEVVLLSDAIYSLRAGLRSFQKYVPATLVRQLIETGENARLGGTKKSLAIFFSDIQDFTKIAEKIDPDVLMEHICEYFEELSQIIISEKGTIDKYIGDCIMAFWGAPLAVQEPCYQAARAALICIRRLGELNEFWDQQGKHPFVTRIGLHYGEAIVGNVGSTERINYTVLGDVINVTNRIEGVNKIYGTSIMVSHPFFLMIKDHFVLRKIDRITLRGKAEISDVYELLAENKNELPFDIDRYSEIFEKGFAAYQAMHWDEAIHQFENCLKVYPDDTVAPVFIIRCKNFKLHPPKNWQGVWVVVEK